MLSDISAIVAKAAPSKEPDGDEKREAAPASLQVAAEEILAALGQDYGSSPNADRGQREAFEDKRDRLVVALRSFCEIVDSGPHTEGEHR